MKYSISKKSAFPEFVKYDDLPNDLVEVSDEDHRRILERKISEDYLINGNGSVIIIEANTSKAYDFDEKKRDWVLNKTKQAELAAQAEQQSVYAVKHALQAHIDSVAVGLGFSGGNTVMLYAGFANAFQSLAQAFGAWEAGIWVQANQYMAQVKSGDAPMLTPAQAVERVPSFEFTGA